MHWSMHCILWGGSNGGPFENFCSLPLKQFSIALMALLKTALIMLVYIRIVYGIENGERNGLGQPCRSKR